MPLTGLPIVSDFRADPSGRQWDDIARLCRRLKAKCPELGNDDRFRHLRLNRITEAPSLVFDDFSEIAGVEGAKQTAFLQERARLRAISGDIVVTEWPPPDCYQRYCEQTLGLGSVQWLNPAVSRQNGGVTASAWKDRSLRHALIRAIRADGLRHVHPHMGSFAAWELADLLHRASRRPLAVIAPPPALCGLVNDKVRFTGIVQELLGVAATPVTRSAGSVACLVHHVRQLSDRCVKLCVKLPNSAGSHGIVVLDAAELRRLSPPELYGRLQDFLESVGWSGTSRLLVDQWETDVLCSPSLQIWIPPEGLGLPVVEGIFEQQTTGLTCHFTGCRPARLESPLRTVLQQHGSLLACMFQKLGYVGRCSFDTIVAGDSLSTGRVEFVECNGRWGGTSLPMTMMNRLFGDYRQQPFLTTAIPVKGLESVSFERLLQHPQIDLYRADRGTGCVVFFAPGRMESESAIDATVLGTDFSDAERSLIRLRHQLREIAADAGCPDPESGSARAPVTAVQRENSTGGPPARG